MRCIRTIASCGIVLVLFVSVLSLAGAQKTPLNRSQVRHLIRIQAPDSLIASQIRSRGLSFTVTPTIVQTFAAEGAGSETLTALRAQIRAGSATIHSEPGSQVLIDGKAVGTTNAEGVLMVNNIEAGQHKLLITKDGYQNDSRSLTISSQELAQVTGTLKWLGGFLTVSAQPQDSTISITGPQRFSGTLNGVKCQAGKYTITVSSTGYATQTLTFEVAAGAHQNETIQLEVDPAYISKLLASAADSLSSGNPSAAIAAATRVRSLSPGNISVESILSEASFQTGNLQEFVNDGVQAIHGGKSVTVTLMHLHNFPSKELHPVRMTISPAGVAFVPLPSDRNDKIPVSLSYGQIWQALVRRDPTGVIAFTILWSPAGHHTFVRIIHELEFVPVGSQVVRSSGSVLNFGGTSESVRMPSNAIPSFEAIVALIKSAQS